MTQGERIKELRKNILHLTLDKFGERLGVRKSTISEIEHGRNNLSDQMAKSICREFHVNESWLRSGEGEIFLEDNEDYYADIDRIMQGEDETRRNLFKFLIDLDDNDLIALRRIMDKALAFSKSKESHSKGIDATAAPNPSDQDADPTSDQGEGRRATLHRTRKTFDEMTPQEIADMVQEQRDLERQAEEGSDLSSSIA